MSRPTLLLRRFFASAPAPTPSPTPLPTAGSSSSSTLPLLISSALSRSPIFAPLVADPSFCKSLNEVAGVLLGAGLGKDPTKAISGEDINRLYSDESGALPAAVKGLREVVESKKVPDQAFQPVLAALFAQGGLKPFQDALDGVETKVVEEERKPHVHTAACGHGHHHHKEGEGCS